MDLFINSYGGRLTQAKKQFRVKTDAGSQRVSAAHVRSICFTQACLVSTDAIKLAMQHEIPMVVVSRTGKPLGRWWPGRFAGNSAVRRAQFRVAGQAAALGWMQGELVRKARAQQRLLDKLARRKGKRAERLQGPATQIGMLAQGYETPRTGTLAEQAASLRGLEGNISQTYFQALGSNLPKAYRFPARSRKPALDPFNATLNYLYGMLYRQAETALILAGLDPYVPLFHREQAQRPALCFDFIEAYRPWADWVAVQMCLQKKLGPEATIQEKGEVRLTDAGRKTLILAFQAYMEAKVSYRQQKRRRREVLLDAGRELAGWLLSESEAPTS
ncbi:MAG: CRISPR-associated endonuclease Cas1 [Bacteroidetes bacterium]|nr:MAG: CRISPR-associated endonuclease Cas1 [Bacteroidota bacterium]